LKQASSDSFKTSYDENIDEDIKVEIDPVHAKIVISDADDISS